MNLKARINKFLLKVLSEEQYRMLLVRYLHIAERNKEEKYALPYYMIKDRKAREKYYIFRFRSDFYGLFSTAILYAFAYDWAEKKGYIPVIDYEFPYIFSQYKLGEKNAWEYVFEQSIEVRDVLHKKWVMVSNIGLMDEWYPETCKELNGDEKDHRFHIVRGNWREYYAKAHILASRAWTFRKEFLEEFYSQCEMNVEREQYIGVVLREEFSAEADKIRNSSRMHEVYRHHPLVPGVEETIELVDEYMQKWNCSKIFLSTMFQESLELFIEKFGDKVVFVERERKKMNFLEETEKRFKMSNEELYNYWENAGNDYYKNSFITYAKEILGVANCQYLLGAPSGGTVAALTLNGGKYKDIYILDDANGAQNY